MNLENEPEPESPTDAENADYRVWAQSTDLFFGHVTDEVHDSKFDALEELDAVDTKALNVRTLSGKLVFSASKSSLHDVNYSIGHIVDVILARFEKDSQTLTREQLSLSYGGRLLPEHVMAESLIVEPVFSQQQNSIELLLTVKAAVWANAPRTFSSGQSGGSHCTNFGGRSARVEVVQGDENSFMAGIRSRFYRGRNGPDNLRDSDKVNHKGLWRRTSKHIEIVDGSVLVQHLTSDEFKVAFENEDALLQDLINFVQSKKVFYWKSQSDYFSSGYVCFTEKDTSVEALVGGTRISMQANYSQADH